MIAFNFLTKNILSDLRASGNLFVNKSLIHWFSDIRDKYKYYIYIYIQFFFKKKFFILFKKKYITPSKIPILIIWIPNKEKNSIFNPKYFFANIKNLYSKIIWKINDMNNPDITNHLSK